MSSVQDFIIFLRRLITLQTVLAAEMRKRLRNMAQYAKKRVLRNSTEDKVQRSLDEIKDHMKEEMKKLNPSISVLQRDLEACRSKRRQDAKKASSAAEHLTDYPALKYSDLVRLN